MSDNPSSRSFDPADLPVPGSLSFDGPVLVADPTNPVFAAVARTSLSPSTSNAMQDCPARWFMEKLIPSECDPFSPANIGSVAHAVFEDLFDRPFDKRTRQDAHDLLLTIHERHSCLLVPLPDGKDVTVKRGDLLMPADPFELARFRDRVLLVMEGLWQIEDPGAVQVGQREQYLNGVEINGVPISGFVDRVDPVVDDNGELGWKIVDYKGLATNTPLPTPTGWTTMEDVAVGDQVLGTQGQPVNVVVKSGVHHRPCYRVDVSDGTHIVCDNVHLWTVNIGGVGRCVDTDELFEIVDAGTRPVLPDVVPFVHDQHRIEVGPRSIVSVSATKTVPTMCIGVDSPDSLYLCASTMVPTHNTGKWHSAHKLRTYGDSYAEQMRIYALAIEQIYGRPPVAAELYYTAEGKKREVGLGPRLMRATSEKFADSWDKLSTFTSTGRWPMKPSGLCNYCPLATVCPGAAERDRPAEPANDLYQVGEFLFPAGENHSSDEPPPLDEPVILDPEEPEPSRHTPEVTAAIQKENDMSTGPWKYEDKPFEETVQGELNPNSYAMTAVFGLASLAHDLLVAHGQPITGRTVPAMAHTLSSIVLTAQGNMSGSANFQRGLNTRLRGALRSVVEATPPPFGASVEVWAQWHDQAAHRVTSIARVALDLWSTGMVDRPWAALVDSTTSTQTTRSASA